MITPLEMAERFIHRGQKQALQVPEVSQVPVVGQEAQERERILREKYNLGEPADRIYAERAVMDGKNEGGWVPQRVARLEVVVLNPKTGGEMVLGKQVNLARRTHS